MSFSMMKPLPSPGEIQEKYPLSPRARKAKETRDEAIRKVITGESNQFLVIIGPCSADNEDAVCDYVSRLVKVQEKVAEKADPDSQNLYQQTQNYRGKATRALSTSRIRRKNRTWPRDSSPCAICTSALWRSQVFPPPTRCCIRTTGATCLISCPTWPSAPALWKISSTGLQCPASISRWA